MKYEDEIANQSSFHAQPWAPPRISLRNTSQART